MKFLFSNFLLILVSFLFCYYFEVRELFVAVITIQFIFSLILLVDLGSFYHLLISDDGKINKIKGVEHSFYTEIFEELISYLQNSKKRLIILEEQLISGHFLPNILEHPGVPKVRKTNIELGLELKELIAECKAKLAFCITYKAQSSELELTSTENYTSNLEGYLFKKYRSFFEQGKSNLLGLIELADDFELASRLRAYGLTFIIALPLKSDHSLDQAVLLLGYASENYPEIRERYNIFNLAQRLYDSYISQMQISKYSIENESLEQEKKASHQLFSEISHDLRSPLHNINTILKLCSSEKLQPEQLELIVLAIKNCSALEEIISDILDYNRSSLGVLSAHKQSFPLDQLLQEVFDCFKTRFEESKIDFHIVKKGSSFEIMADRKQIRRVLNNLVSNALKYTKFGKVILSVKNTNGKIEVEVSDSGHGMSSEQLTQAFVPFKRFAEGQDGVGLGLTVSRILTEINGGNIQIVSQEKVGTKIKIVFPQVISHIELCCEA